MKLRALVALVLASCCAQISLAIALPREAFSPRQYQDDVVGERTQVLVLATPHLALAPDDFDAGVLEGLLEKLQAFDPDVVAVENVSGEGLSALSVYDSIYPDVARSFGSSALQLAELARAHVGLDLPHAEAEARLALQQLDNQPTEAQRCRLVLLFLAAGDPNSALVQWWRLTPEARAQASDEVPEEVRVELETFAFGRNESAFIGARLAARLGLERVHPIDDQSAVDLMFPIAQALGAAIEADRSVAEGLARPDFTRLASAGERLRSVPEALNTYRELNTPRAGLADVRAQWSIMIDRAYPADAGRIRMGEWEARNLRMAANIREAAASAPGGRVLVIVGVSHKPWLDAYLDLMTDMRVVDARRVLR